MVRYRVIGNPENKEFCSSKIIIDNINNAAVKLGLYDCEGVQVNYSCLCEDFGLKTDAWISVFELPYPKFILDNAKGKPILGVSRDNQSFLLAGGYPVDKVSYVNLGVQSDIWKTKRDTKNDKFIVLCNGESNSRSCFIEIIQAFGELFSGREDVQLYIRDRDATDLFKQYVRDEAASYNIDIVHDDRFLTNPQDEIGIYEKADINVSLNKSSTWNLRAIESLSCAVPTISMEYSGMREYIQNYHSGLSVDYKLEEVTDGDINEAQSMGLKNYLFYPSQLQWVTKPYWAVPNVGSIKECLNSLYESNELRKRLSINGRKMAEHFTWTKTALNLSLELERWFV